MPTLDQINNRSAQRKNFLTIAPYIIAFFSLLLIGQIIVQFMSLKQLNKDSGTIIDSRIEIISWSTKRGITGSRNPNYGLVLYLDNGHIYNIENAVYRERLNKELHKGDVITIYYPTTMLKILSTGFYHDVNQLERGNEVLYSFAEQKKDGYALLALFTASIALILFIWNFQRKYAI